MMKVIVEIKFRKPAHEKHIEAVRKTAQCFAIDKTSVVVMPSPTKPKLVVAEFTIKKMSERKAVEMMDEDFLDLEDAVECSLSFPEDEPEAKSPRGKKPAISPEIREQVVKIVEEFNRKKFKNEEIFYVPRFQGKYLYLDRSEYGKIGPICRLEFLGDIDSWEFAIFTYSDERYEPSGFCPGMEELDGSIVGAMKAGLEAYPV